MREKLWMLDFVQLGKDKVNMDNFGLRTTMHGLCTCVHYPYIRIIHDLINLKFG